MISLKKSRIHSAFQDKPHGEKIMSLFITAGYPDIDSSVDLILGFEQNGADIIELGMPFSDPLADGPTIQYASNVAISNGITMKRIFEIVREVRKTSDIPIILMGYINPVYKYGVELFCYDAIQSGADGLIIPDAPPEESSIIAVEAKKAGLEMIYLVAPNTSDRRMQLVDDLSSGFVYCVSITGVTGARSGDEVANSVGNFIDRVKTNVTKNPVLVGFGIKNHEDAMRIAKKTDGYIVGSALIETIRNHYPNKDWKDHVFNFVKKLKFGNL